MLRDMSKDQGAKRIFLPVRPPNVYRTGVMIALNPNPVATRLQSADRAKVRFAESFCCSAIVKAVPQTQNGSW